MGSAVRRLPFKTNRCHGLTVRSLKMLGFKVCNSDITRDRSTRGMLWLGSSLAILLVLLPLISFAQAHLWKYQSFRAFDTGHSGGDHICDLRRDSNGLGRPDRLGDYVTFSGTVIAEPSTYETGGWLFWVRQAGCGACRRPGSCQSTATHAIGYFVTSANGGGTTGAGRRCRGS